MDIHKIEQKYYEQFTKEVGEDISKNVAGYEFAPVRTKNGDTYLIIFDNAQERDQFIELCSKGVSQVGNISLLENSQKAIKMII